ncbi:MAG: tRNA-dihydrouridine synthase family protein, partial [Campylobacterota bacterium]|nr:tRNA-dihydrouridine synthase family protein [Campylobacterota bacterium]
MIEKLSFDKPIYVLAPLAGFTDLPFRSVVKKFGADLTVSEMLSSNALAHGSKKTIHMLQKATIEDPYSVQIAGSDVDIVRRAVEVLNEQDGIDIIDLNCGCPVPKVVGHGSGSSLLLNLPLMGDIIRTIKETSNKSLTSAKIRLGFEKKNHIDIAKMVQDSGADFIAVHGRTRAGKFKAAVDYDAIKEVKEAVSIPVIANGDIDSYEKAKWVLEHTGSDGVMIG